MKFDYNQILYIIYDYIIMDVWGKVMVKDLLTAKYYRGGRAIVTLAYP